MEKMTAAQQQMVLDNYNLVHYVMHKKFSSYYPGSYEYEDLSQEGYLGLCLAAMRYDDEKASFTTYAFNYIWGKIICYINTKSGWAFHYRTLLDDGRMSDYMHISYGSLNEFTCESNSSDKRCELFEIIPDRNCDCDYDRFEIYIDLLPAFKKASSRYGEKIFELSLEGYAQRELSSIIGISRPQLSRILNKAKDIYFAYQTYNPKYPDPVVLEMLDKGYSKKIIADILNVDLSYIKRVIYNNRK